MARPIEPTPTLTGDDAERLLNELERIASPEEIARREEAAHRFLAQASSPTGVPLPSSSPEPPAR
jgi:hypothetical protein